MIGAGVKVWQNACKYLIILVPIGLQSREQRFDSAPSLQIPVLHAHNYPTHSTIGACFAASSYNDARYGREVLSRHVLVHRIRGSRHSQGSRCWQ